MAKKEESLAPRPSAYLANVADVKSVGEALRENIGEESISRFDFPRITIPQGDGKFMNVITAEDPEGEAMKTVSGIIVSNHMARSYWKDAKGDNDGPPDCSSPDAAYGEGDPGGDCSTCLFAQFGSDGGGAKRGQACKQMRTLYILRPGMLLPVVINVPPTSLKTVRQYLFQLSAIGRAQYTVETEIGLLPKTSKGNDPYNQFTFKRLRFLDGDELAVAQQYAQMFSAMMRGGREEHPPVPSAPKANPPQADIEDDEEYQEDQAE